MSSLIKVSEGGYSTLSAGGAIADGVVALPGFEIVQATFAAWVPLEQAFQKIAVYLEQHRRPMKALCALQLRSPEPFSPEGFATFNQGYMTLLESYHLLIDSTSPLARTNVVPASLELPSVYAFSYTIPSQERRKTFVAAGVGDIRDDGSLICSGETSEEAWLEKVHYMKTRLHEVLQQLEVTWQQVTRLNFYGPQPLPSSALGILAGALRHGVTWYPSVPPIVGVDTEIDVRGVYQEFFDLS